MKNINIAIADDHDGYRSALKLILEQWGYTVCCEAANGKELIRHIENLPAIPKVCILDVNMPVMNGFQTAAAIKERWPVVKIIANSMNSSEMAIGDMLQSGADKYICKGTDEVEDLKNIIHELM